METQQDQTSVYENTIVNIINKLPADKISELIDFAKFLESQYLQKKHIEPEEKWNNLLTEPKAKRVMREMAQEALNDYYAGKTTNIAVTKDERLVPA